MTSNYDKNTLNGALLTLGELMENNLQAMGVDDADMNNGLMTLAEQVLDVEPSVSGLDSLILSLSLNSNKNSVSNGESVTLSSVLSASYNDRSVTNVDLSGVITGATIIFKDIISNTILGTAITDSMGIATLTFTANFNEDVNIQAIFNGSNNFNNCNSSTQSITVMRSMNLTSNIDNLTNEIQNITFTATLLGNSNNCTVKWYNDNTLLDTTSFTNNVSTCTYTTTGEESELNISAVLYLNNDILLTETYALGKYKLYLKNVTQGLGVGRWVSDWTIELNTIIEFRFKNIPTHFTFGFGNASTNDCVLEKTGNTMNLYRNVNANRSNVGGYSYFSPIMNQTDASLFCKKYIYQSGHYGFGLVHSEDYSYWDYWECGNSGNHLIIQTYDNTETDFEVDIIVH